MPFLYVDYIIFNYKACEVIREKIIKTIDAERSQKTKYIDKEFPPHINSFISI